MLPARIPNLLVNGATGIAVGMATNIPPHNLGEVCTALIKLLDNPDLSSVQLCRYVKGPDFPTGGQILNSADELKEIYKTGSGTVRLRATWEEGPETRSAQTIYITSIPYTVNKAALVERIADVVLSRKLPPLLDVKDVSTDDVRIALELKQDADPQDGDGVSVQEHAAPDQLHRQPDVPDPDRERGGRPARAARSEVDPLALPALPARGRDQPARARARGAAASASTSSKGSRRSSTRSTRSSSIIRKSDGKADAAEKIMKRFELDAEQTDAILELKLYRLARLEILVIQNELADKRKRARQITGLLKDEDGRWKVVRDEIEEIQETYGKSDKRRTLIESDEEVAFTADDFIVEEDNVVIVSRDGWVKRQKEVRDLSTTRLREGDSVLAVLPGSTRATVVFFTQLRRGLHVAHHRRAGVNRLRRAGAEAVQAARRRAGDRGVQPRSARRRRDHAARRKARSPPVHALAVTSDGYSLRFSLEPFVEPSTRAGRRYARPSDGVEVVGVAKITGDEIVIAATAGGARDPVPRRRGELPVGPGQGRDPDQAASDEDRVLGFIASTGDRDLMRVETSRGAEQTISTDEIRGDRPRRQGPRAAAARPVHARDSAGRREPAASVGITRTPNAQLPIPNHSQFPIPKNAQVGVGRWDGW